MKTVSVLLVAGQKDDVDLVRDLLSKAQHTLFCIDWADSFEAGEKALKNKLYDIALVDDDLGFRRGSQFIQQEEHNGVDVPVILFTCNECWAEDQAAFASDAIYCLVRDKMTSEMLERIILKELDWKHTIAYLQI